ncbi:MAG TPA: VanZ family protein [Burkholderiales bacterium]|nr:VanZ family protein [Burkholderiales bacterium]
MTAYASLYPLEGWHNHGLHPFAYLDAPWPRYITTFDIAVNLLGYMPYGFLCVAALGPRLRGVGALVVAIGSGFILSLALEAAQSYLPARVAVNLDVLCNLAGAVLGATLGALLVPRWMREGPVGRARAALFLPGVGIDVGLVLVGLWLFVQLNPATLLFAAGDLRDLVAATPGRARRPEFFAGVEAFTAAANLVGVGLLVSALTRPGQPVRTLIYALVGSALAVKIAAFAVVMRAENVLAWLTPGAQYGLVLGLVAVLFAVRMPPTARLAMAAVLLMAATVLVNLAPPNPYLVATLKLWQQGHFLNFNGLTRLVSALWVFAALAYLIYLAARRRDAPDG